MGKKAFTMKQSNIFQKLITLSVWTVIVSATTVGIFFYYGLLTLLTSPYVKRTTHFIMGRDGNMMPASQAGGVPPIAQSTQAALLEKLTSKKGYAVLFSPDDDLTGLMSTLIAQEKTAIKLAIFNFTDGMIASYLIAACKREVSVEIITDRSGIGDRYTKIDELYNAGATIYIYNPNWGNKKRPGIMHHKFMLLESNITGRGIVWTGSFNFTKSARFYNQENVVILNRSGATKKFARQFAILKERSSKYRPFIST
jgi:phosphatidylserine/phosphatidylglycerophosphate/cardiolipin synthase-like enzyme